MNLTEPGAHQTIMKLPETSVRKQTCGRIYFNTFNNCESHWKFKKKAHIGRKKKNQMFSYTYTHRHKT